MISDQHSEAMSSLHGSGGVHTHLNLVTGRLNLKVRKRTWDRYFFSEIGSLGSCR